MKIALALLAGVLVLSGCHADTTGDKAQGSTTRQSVPADRSGPKAGGAVVTESDLGVPFYPGSTPLPDGNLTGNAGGYSVHTAIRTTPDSSQKVIDFYKDAFTKAGYKLANEAVAADTATVDGLKGDGDMLSCTFTHDKDQPTSQISLKRTRKA